MPYSIQMPDGTTIADIPDELSFDDAKSQIVQKFPQYSPKTGILETIGTNIGGGLMNTFRGTGAALADVVGADEYAAQLRENRRKSQEDMRRAGGETLLGEASSIAGSGSPALAIEAAGAASIPFTGPIGPLVATIANAGLFGPGAFKDAYDAQIEKGAPISVAIMHGLAEAGLAIVGGRLIGKGGRLIAKGATEAAETLVPKIARTAAEGAAFPQVGQVLNKGIDTLTGQQNDESWFAKPQTIAASALAMGALGAAHHAIGPKGAAIEEAPPPVAEEPPPPPSAPLAERPYADLAKDVATLSAAAKANSATPEELSRLKEARAELQRRGVEEVNAQRAQIVADEKGKESALAAVEPQQVEMREAMPEGKLPPQTDLFGKPVQPAAEQPPVGLRDYVANEVPPTTDIMHEAGDAVGTKELEAAGQMRLPLPPSASVPITASDIAGLGIPLKTAKTWVNDNIVGKTLEQVQSLVKTQPNLVNGDSARAKLLRELLQPEVPAYKEPANVKPIPPSSPAVEPTAERGGGKPSMGVPVEPVGNVKPVVKPIAPPIAQALEKPIGLGLVSPAPPVSTGNVPEGKPAPAVVAPKDTITRLRELMQDPRTRPAIKREAAAAVDAMTNKGMNETAEDVAGNLRLAQQLLARVSGTEAPVVPVVKPGKAPVEPIKPRGMFEGLTKEGAAPLAEEAPAPAAEKPKSAFDTTGPSLLGEQLAPSKEETSALKAARAAKGATRYRSEQEAPEVPIGHTELQGIADTVGKSLGGKSNALILDSVTQIDPSLPAGSRAGMLKDGQVYLFRDGIASGIEGVKTVFHELLHKGLRDLLPTEQYVKVMNRLHEQSATIRDAAQKWMASAEGIAAKEKYAKEYPGKDQNQLAALRAEAVDEVLARVAEKAKSNPTLLRQLGNWFAGIADSLGLKPLANTIRKMGQTPLNKFIQDALHAAAQGTENVKREYTPADMRNRISAAGEAAIAQQDTKVKTAVKESKSAAETRTMVTDSMASVSEKINRVFKGAVRDPNGRINPMASLRQAADVSKMLLEYVMKGDMVKDAATGLWESVANSKITPPAAVFDVLKKWSADNGYTYKVGKHYASRVLEAVRLEGLMHLANTTGLKFVPHMKPHEIAALMKDYRADPVLQSLTKLMDAPRIQLVNHMEKVGRLTPEEAKQWREVVGYVPFDRIDDISSKFSKVKRVSGKGVGQVGKLPELVGSAERPVGDVFANYVGTLGWMMRQVTHTDASINTLRQLERQGLATFIGPDSKASKTGIVQEAWVKGEKVFFDLQTKYDKMAFADLNPPTAAWLRAMGKVSNVLRVSVTALPPFALKQVVEDVQRAVFTSGVQNPASLIWKSLRNFGQLAVAELAGKRHPLVAKFAAKGISGEVDFHSNDAAKYLEQHLGYEKRNIANALLHRLDGITRASDLAVRAAVHEQTMLETGNELLASTRARELINFRRRGASDTVGALITTIPFFNAYLQGTDLIYRNATGSDSSTGLGKAEAAKQFFTRAATMATFSLLYAIAKSDDKDYTGMDLNTRNNNWIVGNGIKIPVASEYAALFKVIPEAVVEYMKRQGTPEEQTAGEATRNALTYVYQQFAGRIAPIPLAAKPLIEAFTNYSFTTGRQLEGTYQQGLEGHLRVNSTTSELAIEIAKFVSENMHVEVSPIMIDNTLRGYIGSTASLVTMATDSMLNPNRVDRPIEKWALLSNYMYETGEGTGARPTDEFYKLNEVTSKAAHTMNELAKTDVDAAIKYGEEHANEIELNKAVQKSLASLSKLRETEKILNSENGVLVEPDKAKRAAYLKQLKQAELDTVAWTREVKAMLKL